MRYHHGYRGLAKLRRKEFARQVHQVHSVLLSQIHHRVWRVSGGMVLAGLPGVDDLLGSFRWYDALYINQANEIERNHQVSQMGEFYKEASDLRESNSTPSHSRTERPDQERAQAR